MKMKKIIFSLLIAVLFLGSGIALAQNETEISSEEKSKPSIKIEFDGMDDFSKKLEKEFDGEKIEIRIEDAGGAIAVGAGIAIFFFILFLASVVFWIAMLVHAVSKPITSKAVWILILLLTGIIGAIVYYFAVKKEFGKNKETLTAEKVEEDK
jgi:hypothetical protein